MAGRWCTEGKWIRDAEGRTVLLRGVNLGGSSKVPLRPDGSTLLPEGLGAGRDVSFVGRPFPLEQADEHFARLAAWGLGFVRLVVTWEAVEHAGPGIYDRAFLDYLHALIRAAGRHEVLVLVDPHQDVWSRWTGGDGAPSWTLTELGFRLETLHASGAALLHQVADNDLPRMGWPANHNRLAAATMFTLFLAGDVYAPGVRLLGEPVQAYLQHRYLETWKMVAHTLRGLDNVVGFGVMNEPSLGFIGLEDIRRLERATLRSGPMPAPLEAMAAGDGHPVMVERWRLGPVGERRAGRILLNPGAVRAWEEGRECPWRREGVWDATGRGPRALRPHHFRAEADPVDVFLKPLAVRFARSLRSVLPEALIFVEGVPRLRPPRWTKADPRGVVHAPHWYDGLTMVSGRYQTLVGADSDTRKPRIGPRAVRRSFATQIARRARQSEEFLGGAPTLIGEMGLPFHRVRPGAAARAFRDWHDALDANLAGAAIWCYTADNDRLSGDHWNREDFSIYRRGVGPDGARGLEGFCRPHALRVAGTPISMSYDDRRRILVLRWRAESAIRAPTVIYVPTLKYPRGYGVAVEPPGALTITRRERAQLVDLHPTAAIRDGVIRVTIRQHSTRPA